MKTKIGKYEILEEIGHGGFAVVYKARHSTLQKEVALKVLNPIHMMDEKDRERFVREARAASSLDHPNIVRIEKLIEEPDHICIAMDYYPEGDLAKYILNNSPIAPEDAIRILGQVAEALDYSHTMGVLHRDIKPSNILMDKKGNPFLSDFGLVRQVGDLHLTQIGTMVGTATYASPEQAQGKLDLNGRSDQYSLVVIAFELLVGQVPFQGDNSTAVALLHVTKTPPVPSSINSSLVPEVDTVLLRGLSKNPNDRYSTCSEFIHALDNAYQTGQLHRFRNLLNASRELLLEGKFDQVKQKLELARTTIPDLQDMRSIFQELEQAQKNALIYEQCYEAYKSAEQKATSVLETFPNYPDSCGVFSILSMRSRQMKWPLKRNEILQVGIGLVTGLAGGFLLLLISYLIITK